MEIVTALAPDRLHHFVALDGKRTALSMLGEGVRHVVHEPAIRRTGGLSLANLHGLRSLLRQVQPELLLTYNWGAIEAVLANRVRPLAPHVHFEDGFGPDEAAGRQRPRRVWTRRIALSGVSRVVVPSHTLQRIALDSWRLDPARVTYIPNGIHLQRFARLPSEGVRTGPEVVIGTVAALRPEKNLSRLLRVFARLPEHTRLVICGDGPERRRLEDEAASLGIISRTSFTGHQQEPETVLARLDVFALTSDTEQMPYSVIEAMAAGLPVVATDVGDVRRMLPEEGQILVAAPAGEERLAGFLMRLIEDPDGRRQIGDANRSHALAHYGRERMLQRYADLIGNLIGCARLQRHAAELRAASAL